MRELILRRRSDLLALGFLLLLTAMPFADVIGGYNSLYIRDLTRYYYPTKRVIREVIQHGEFPFWNRYYSAGQPMAANPEYEIFYPPQWLVLLPDYDLGYRLHILLHIWLAVIGMYTFLRSLRTTIIGSSFGALMWALGGLMVSMINLLPILFCMVWMPFIFLFTRRYLKRAELRDLCCASLFLGIQMLTAEPTTLLQTWSLMGLYALYRAWHSETRMRTAVTGLARVVVLGICGALVGAAQMIPAFDHARESARSRPFELALVSAWSFHPARPLELLFPHIFGYVDHHGSLYWASSFYKGTGSPFYFNIYFGLLGAAFLVAAFFVRPRGGRTALVVGAISYVVAIGVHTPLLKFLYDHHVATSLRYFEKFTLMGLFVAILMSALVADRCLKGDDRVRRIALRVVTLTLIVGAAAFTFSLTRWYPASFRQLWGLGNTMVGRRMTAASGADWGWVCVRAAVAITVLELIRRRRFGKGAAIVTAVLMMIDFSWVGLSTLPRQPRRFFTPPPLVKRFDREPSTYRIFHEADWYNNDKVAQSYFSTGDAIYWIVRNGLFPMTPASWGLPTVLERDYDKTALLPTVDLIDAMWKVRDKGQKRWAEMFMSMSNARYRGTWVPLEEARRRCHGNFKNAEPVRFVHAVAVWPRYFFAERLVHYSSVAAFENALIATKDWTPRTVYTSGEGFTPAAATLLHVHEAPNSATFEVQSSGRSFLYMSVTPHKYWSATIDGRPLPLTVANVGYQGVEVPAGRHHIAMRYRNTLVVKMGFLSLGSFLLFVVGAILPRRRRDEGEITVVGSEPAAAGAATPETPA